MCKVMLRFLILEFVIGTLKRRGRRGYCFERGYRVESGYIGKHSMVAIHGKNVHIYKE